MTPSSRVLDEVRFIFRRDLIVTQQGDGFVIKDPVKNAFARLGSAEYLVARHFDGESTLAQIAEKLRAEREVIVPMEKLVSFRDRLHEKQLIIAPDETVAGEETPLGSTTLLSRIIMIPIPIRIDPDLFLTRLFHRTKRIFFRPAYVVFTVVALILALQVWLDSWPSIRQQAATLGSVKNLVIFWFVFALSVSLHEIAHGYATKAYGGEVRRMGLFLYFFNLAFYTDVSDAWLFSSKSRQFMVIWAGAYTTIVLCCVSTLLWRITLPGSELNNVFFVAMTFNAFGSAFTLTPFLRGDGYYMLSSLLDIPNLRERSFTYTKILLRRIFLGSQQPLPKATPREARIFVIYGVSTILFLTIFFGVAGYNLAGLILGKTEALGLIFVAFLLHNRLGSPLHRATAGMLRRLRDAFRASSLDGAAGLRSWMLDEQRIGREWIRRSAPLGLAIATAAGAILLIPYPLQVTAPFEVISPRPSPVRARVAGVLEQVAVKSGERVREGQVVGRLLDRDLVARRLRASAILAEAEAHLARMKLGYRDEEKAAAKLAADSAAARLRLAKITHARIRGLHAKKVVATAELEKSKAELDRASAHHASALQDVAITEAGSRKEEIEEARARLEAARSDLQLLDQQIAWVDLVSAADGIVMTSDEMLQSSLGSYFERGSTLLTIADPSQLVARIRLPEKELGEVRTGSAVVLRAYEAPDRAFASTVERAELAVEQGEVGILSPIGDAPLRIGSKGAAKIDCGTHSLAALMASRFSRSYLVELWSWW